MFHIAVATSGFFLFDISCAFYFMDLFFRLQTVLGRFILGLTFIILAVVLANLVIFFAHFSLIFETFTIAESVETVVGRGTSGRNAGYHDYFTGLVLAYKRISQDEGQFRGSERDVVSLVVHGSNALLQS